MDAKGLQVVVDWIIELESPVVVKPHEPGRRHRLCDRCDPKDRVRVNWSPSADVSQTRADRLGTCPKGNDCHPHTGEAVPTHRRCQQRLQTAWFLQCLSSNAGRTGLSFNISVGGRSGTGQRAWVGAHATVPDSARCGLGDRSASRKGALIKPGRWPPERNGCAKPAGHPPPGARSRNSANRAATLIKGGS